MALTVPLTAGEAELVRRKSKKFSDRPQIFRPGLGLQTINDDFEAFLILSSVGARTSMALMLNVLLQYTAQPTTRNAAYKEMLLDCVIDAKTRQSQAQQILGAFDASFQGLDPGKFKSVPSVNTMRDDLFSVVSALEGLQDFANYQFALAFSYNQTGAGTTDDSSVQQMVRSYYTALLAYV